MKAESNGHEVKALQYKNLLKDATILPPVIMMSLISVVSTEKSQSSLKIVELLVELVWGSGCCSRTAATCFWKLTSQALHTTTNLTIRKSMTR